MTHAKTNARVGMKTRKTQKRSGTMSLWFRRESDLEHQNTKQKKTNQWNGEFARFEIFFLRLYKRWMDWYLKRVLESGGERIWKHVEREKGSNELCPVYSIVVYKLNFPVSIRITMRMLTRNMCKNQRISWEKTGTVNNSTGSGQITFFLLSPDTKLFFYTHRHMRASKTSFVNIGWSVLPKRWCQKKRHTFSLYGKRWVDHRPNFTNWCSSR